VFARLFTWGNVVYPSRIARTRRIEQVEAPSVESNCKRVFPAFRVGVRQGTQIVRLSTSARALAICRITHRLRHKATFRHTLHNSAAKRIRVVDARAKPLS
jgi:hypothetical protein